MLSKIIYSPIYTRVCHTGAHAHNGSFVWAHSCIRVKTKTALMTTTTMMMSMSISISISMSTSAVTKKKPTPQTTKPHTLFLTHYKWEVCQNPEDRSHFSAPQYTITIINIIHFSVSSCLILMFFRITKTNPQIHARKQSNHKWWALIAVIETRNSNAQKQKQKSPTNEKCVRECERDRKIERKIKKKLHCLL